MSALQGSSEYRDAWRGLRLHVPGGWQVRRSGAGLTAHDLSGLRLLIVQPRPGAPTLDELQHALTAWLRRLDPRAELQRTGDGSDAVRFTTTQMGAAAGSAVKAVFALQRSPAGGLITGYLAPTASLAEDSQVAEAALASLRGAPATPRRLWQEETEGACTAVVPQGWRPEGHVDRANPAGVGAVSFQAWAGPVTGVLAGGQGRMFMEPGLLTGLMGSLSGGLVSQGRYVDAAGYVQAYLLPNLSREYSQVQIEAILPRPDVVVQAAAHEAAVSGLSLTEILKGEPTGVDALLTYRVNGMAVRQLSRIITLRVPPMMGRGLPMWMAMQPYSYRAAVEEWASLEPVLEGVAQAFRVSPEWQRAEQERVRRAFAGRLPGLPRESLDAEPLLHEAEKLLCSCASAQPRWHERPFCLGQAEEDQKAALGVSPDLYERCLWTTHSA
ncbi:MAG: hypothetical protein ACUVX9_18080 [Anaerolineae bacterium]